MVNLDIRSRLLIEPSLHFLYDENNCFHKIKKLQAHLKDRDLAIQAHEANSNCNAVSAKIVAETDQLIFHKCLCKTYDPNIHHFLEIYKAYKKGNLPFAGGFLDQPSIFIEIINTIDQTLADIEEAQNKKSTKQSKRK